MDFNLKKYRILKTKKQLKKSELIFIFHSAKIKSNKWITVEKKLKKLKLKYNQIYNKTTTKTLKNSIYKNMNQLISSVILLVTTAYKSSHVNIKVLNKELESLFVLLFLKLNNKIYTQTQFKKLDSLSYKQTVLKFNTSLERCLKTSYILTNKKSK